MTITPNPSGPTLPPAGWYPDPQSDAHQRWWSGLAWTEHAREEPGPEPTPAPMVVAPAWASAKLRNTPATRALVLGLIVVAFAAAPYVYVAAIGAGLIAVVLGVLGARRSVLTGTGLAKSLTGIGLAVGGIAAAATIGVAVTALVGPITHEPVAELTSPSVSAPYSRPETTSLASMLSAPDAATGAKVILNGRVLAANRATCAFTASVTNANKDGDYAGSAWFSRATDCTPLHRGDLVKIWAVVVGAHSTASGGTMAGLSATKVTTH